MKAQYPDYKTRAQHGRAIEKKLHRLVSYGDDWDRTGWLLYAKDLVVSLTMREWELKVKMERPTERDRAEHYEMFILDVSKLCDHRLCRFAAKEIVRRFWDGDGPICATDCDVAFEVDTRFFNEPNLQHFCVWS